MDTLTWFIKSINATLNAFESEIENYRRRLERVEEMTTRFESGHEEN
jgi:prefoldin subunit 5